MGILAMPPPAARPALRTAADALAAAGGAAPDREALAAIGSAALARCGLGGEHLGYAMILASNAWWKPAFAAVPPERRLLLLPHCLRPEGSCPAAPATSCHGCGGCGIDGLARAAAGLGYRTVVAEGAGAVFDEVVLHGRDAVLGVACLDALDRAFARVRELGLPVLAVPLERDGCRDTAVEEPEVAALLRLRSAGDPAHRSCLPLLRAASALCRGDELARLLGPARGGAPVDAAALAWLGEGGKRLRAFVTLAAWAVGRHGEAALRAGFDAAAIPDGVRRLALAVEVLHKASLVHDDIEDGDDLRYGRPTLHRVHGLPAAVNIGDHLLGLGYRLAADAGPAVVARLADAHLALCRGQGAELDLRAAGAAATPAQALAIAAGKTAPAFAAALAVGLLAAGSPFDAPALERYARCLGEAFQAQDDLDDWREDAAAAAGQASLLRALAAERLPAGSLDPLPGEAVDVHAARVRQAIAGGDAVARAEALVERLRRRTLEAAAGLRPETLAGLGETLARAVLVPRGA